MQKAEDAPSRRLLWGATIVWWGSVLLLLPFGRGLINYLRDRNLLTVTITLLLFLSVAAGAWTAIRAWRLERINKTQLWVAVCYLAVVLALVQLLPRVEERWHVVQYGVVACLAWWAIRGSLVRRLVIGTLVASIFGWLDEAVQYLLPDRVYDNLDVALNAGSGFVGALCLTILARLGEQRGAEQ